MKAEGFEETSQLGKRKKKGKETEKEGSMSDLGSGKVERRFIIAIMEERAARLLTGQTTESS